MMVHICTKFNENILDSIKIIEWTQFSFENFSKEHNSVKNVDEVTVLILCTSADSGLYLYKLS